MIPSVAVTDMMIMIPSVLCFLDATAVLGYASMTICVYLSAFLPMLKDLSLHGKTRGEGVSESSSSSSETNATKVEQQDQSSLSLFGRLKHWFLHSEWFLVPKTFFRHFYIMGLLCFGAAVWMRHKDEQQKQQSSSPSSSFQGVWKCISTWLLFQHLFRRLYECYYVHQWRSTSRMHWAGYFVGALHYIWLPFVFVPFSYTQQQQQAVVSPSCQARSRWIRQLFTGSEEHVMVLIGHSQRSEWISYLPAIVLCVFAQYQQYRHHLILANVRRRPDVTAEYKDKPQRYVLPEQGWFPIVTCPHYFAEILVYVSFVWILWMEQRDLSVSIWSFRPLLVLVWVASNLTMSALINHQWYQQNCTPDEMKGRKAIIPWIL
jgi:3-oxo-5-alpha-steroid 4-dehydrogenase 3